MIVKSPQNVEPRQLKTRSQIATNVERVLSQIDDSATSANRKPSCVQLIAVAKYVGVALTRMLIEAGCQTIAESRPQRLWEKHGQLQDPPVEWHLIGRLQKNKINRTAPIVSTIHSLDSLELAAALSKRIEHPIDLLLEVNVSGDASKQGVQPSQAQELLESILELKNLRVTGLMTMSSRQGNSKSRRKEFAALRTLRDSLQRRLGNACGLSELSMGMSNDFHEAILEGATMVRIGSKLFDNVCMDE